MNWTHVLRIAWKDYRRMGAFWLALVAFWLVCFGYTMWSAFQNGHLVAPATVSDLAQFILITGTIYALGWGAITFAAEHEDKTYEMLRSMPISAKNVFYGKLFFGVNSTILLMLALACICLIHAMFLYSQGGSYEFQHTNDYSQLQSFGLSLMGLMIPFSMVIGIFWSLRVKGPLVALALAGGSIAVLTWICTIATAVVFQNNGLGGEMQVLPTAVILVLATVAFYFIDRRQVSRWLPNRHAPPFAGAVEQVAMSERPQSGFRRLLWLHRGQDWSWSVAFCVIAIITMLATSPTFQPLPATFLVFLSGLLGVLAFRADQQEKRFRLLAQIGVGPGTYWFSRLLRPGSAALIISGCVSAMSAGENLFAAFGIDHWRTHVFLFLGCLATFSVGQLASLASASTIIAIAATVVCSSFVWMWLGVTTATHAPLWLSGAPVAVLPLLASYLRVPRWFRETGSWKEWFVPGLAVAVLIVGVPLATAMYRIYEIPSVALPSLLITESTSSTDDEDATVAYRRVLGQLPSINRLETNGSWDLEALCADPVLNVWGENELVVDELSAAANENSRFPDELRPNVAWDRAVTEIAAATLMIAARNAETANQLDKAWDYYSAALKLARHQNDGESGIAGVWRSQWIEHGVYQRLISWGMHPENSQERIDAAAAFLENYRRNQSEWYAAMRGDYAQLRAILENPTELMSLMSDIEQQQLFSIIPFVPWELTRTRRLADYKFARAFEQLDSVRTERLPEHSEPNAMLQQAAKTTFLGQMAAADTEHGYAYAHAEQQRIGAIHQLATIAYHREHGRYPDNFDGLTVGSHPLPDDFYTPGRKLQITKGTRALHIRGPILQSNDAKSSGSATYSDGEYEARHFVLPEFEDWSPERFERRVRESSKQGRQDALREAQQNSEAVPAVDTRSFQGDAEGYVGDAGGYIGWQPDTHAGRLPISYSKVNLYTNLLSTLEGQDTAEATLRTTLGDLLSDSQNSSRIELIHRLGIDGVREFMPELHNMLSDPDPDRRQDTLLVRSIQLIASVRSFGPHFEQCGHRVILRHRGWR